LDSSASSPSLWRVSCNEGKSFWYGVQGKKEKAGRNEGEIAISRGLEGIAGIYEIKVAGYFLKIEEYVTQLLWFLQFLE
jgi:hypothetical protein